MWNFHIFVLLGCLPLKIYFRNLLLSSKSACLLSYSRWLPKHILNHLVSLSHIYQPSSRVNTTTLGNRLKYNYLSLVMQVQYKFAGEKNTYSKDLKKFYVTVLYVLLYFENAVVHRWIRCDNIQYSYPDNQPQNLPHQKSST